MANSKKKIEFERLFMPHFTAAYNLARWLVRNPEDAEDLVQDSYLKGYKSFDSFQGKEAKAWLLAIVRNTCLTWLKRKNSRRKIIDFNEALVQRGEKEDIDGFQVKALPAPDDSLIKDAENKPVHDALLSLPEHYRTVLILREFEDMDYKQIGVTLDIPVGTVMSRISRARSQMKELLKKKERKGQENEM